MNGRLPLSFVEWTNEDAPLAILVHGSRDHARSWDWIAGALRSRFHIVAPDLRGHGDSTWSPDGNYNEAAYVSDLAALCDMLKVSPRRPVTLIGHSLGAHVAVRFAGVLPDRVARLVGIEAVGAPPDMEVQRKAMNPGERVRSWLDELRWAAAVQPRLFASVEEAIERMLSRHPYLTRAQARHLTRHGVRPQKDQWRWKHDPFVGIWPFPEMADSDAEALWRSITCPTLLIYGDKSWPSSLPSRLLDAVPNVQEVRLPHSGHWPQHDSLDPCLRAITHFLDASA